MANEQLSAWLDGELGSSESAQLVKNLARRAEPREACRAYWLIGDCLRGDVPRNFNLSASVMAALDNEPVVLAPKAKKPRNATSQWMPMAAAVAGVAVAVWMGLSLWTTPVPAASATLAQIPIDEPAQLASAESSVDALPDERSYLMAHQASAAGAPMAGVAQYIRSVNIEQTGGR